MTLTAYREASGLTLAALAEQLGVSKGRLSQIENGASCSPKLALDIERITGGRVSASELSTDVALVRKADAA